MLQFARDAPCPDPIPSSALPILRVAAHASGDGWSLTRLGWLYAVLAAAITAAAAWAATAEGLVRVLVLVPPVVPLTDADFSRFFVSTFSEPAGLLGVFALLCGVGTVAVTVRADRFERVVGIALVAGGGLLATTAKVAYAPLLGVALLVCVVTAVTVRRRGSGWRDRLVGPVLAAVIALAAVVPVTASIGWQARHYPAVNAHNLIYTTVLTEVQGSAASLGLPATAARSAGEAYFPYGPAGVPGAEVIAANPVKAQRAAVNTLASHPMALLRSFGVAMQATERTALAYLPSAPWTSATPPTTLETRLGDPGASAPTLRPWLDGMSAPWWPSLLAALGGLVGVAGTVRRDRLSSSFGRLAGVAAVSSVGLAVVAVLGDGYFEIAKHVLPAAYLGQVTLLALVGSVIVVGAEAFKRATHPSRRLEMRR